MAGEYVLRRSSDRRYVFSLQAGDRETILTSERYVQKVIAEAGIEAVRVNAPVDARYERRTSTAGQPYFVLKAANGQVIGKSEMYSSSVAREKGIESVKRNGPASTIVDQT